MSLPFSALLRLVVDAPNRVLYPLIAIALAATAVVAGHRHSAADALTAHPAAPAAAGATAPAQREVPVSRSASRRVGPAPLARGAARARAHRPKHTARARPHAPKLPLARSDAAETIASAKRSTFNVPGHCLQWSREQAGIPSKYADAATAWQHAIGRRPRDPRPPRGAAVYWTGGSSGYGHIAISLGDGKVRSTDAGGSGEVATVPIRRLSAEWHLTYAGWANSINGYKIPGVAPA